VGILTFERKATLTYWLLFGRETVMRSLVYALLFTLGGTIAASAEELKPIQAKNIMLGSIYGVTYYTVEPEGLKVVTTMAAGEATLRVTATLGQDQKVILSVPGTEGAAETLIEFERRGDLLYVGDPLLLN
jgi:predicted aconitase